MVRSRLFFNPGILPAAGESVKGGRALRSPGTMGRLWCALDCSPWRR